MRMRQRALCPTVVTRRFQSMKAPSALARLWRRFTAREDESHAKASTVVIAEVSEVQGSIIVTTGDDQAMAKEETEVAVSEAEIAAHWREEEYFQPSPKFIGQANASDPAIFERFSLDKFPECFKEYADLLTWDHYWHT